MKFTCERQMLLNAINSASYAVPAKPAIPSMEGIYVRAYDDLTLTAYNNEIAITTIVDADIEEEGELVIPSRMFSDIIRKMDDNVINLTASEQSEVEIFDSSSRFRFTGISSDEYPEIPTVLKQASFTIKQSKLASCISQTVYAVSTSDTRPVHTGCKFKLTPGRLTVAAVDSFRLAIRNEAVDANLDMTFIIPGTSLKEVQKLLNDEDEDVIVSIGNNNAMFSIGSYTLITRLLEGNFIDYEAVMPKSADIKVVVSRQSFASGVDRAALVIDEKHMTHVRCVFDFNKVTMTAVTERGSCVEETFTAGDGKGLVIGFNPRYMLEALKNAPATELVLEMNDSTKPIIIKDADPEKDDFCFMVMPIRLSR